MRIISICLFFWTLNGFGQFEIGETAVVFNDTDRDREIETFIYYPAAEAGEDVSLTDGKFPVIAVGHGFVMTYDYYSYIWEHFVPLGYIVVLPNTETTAVVSHGDYGTDLGFVIAAMQNENVLETSMFYEHVSVHSAVVGHSMGGGAAVLAAAEFPEITTLVTLAAAETDPSAITAASDVLQPSLTFAGGADCVTPPEDHQEPIYDNLSDCKGYVLIPDGMHCQFANSNFLCELGEFSCPDAEISEADQHAVVLEVMTPWMDAFLKNDYSSWEAIEALEGLHDTYSLALECSDNGPVLNMEEETFSDEFLYPNPTSDVLWVPASQQGKKFQIYTTDGRIVAEGITQHQIDLSHLEAGLYLIEVKEADGSTATSRIMKTE